jgi:hypothetical protein
LKGSKKKKEYVPKIDGTNPKKKKLSGVIGAVIFQKCDNEHYRM